MATQPLSEPAIQILLSLLACPDCGSEFVIGGWSDTHQQDESEGKIRCVGCGKTFPFKHGVLRFVLSDGYADSFGFEWSRFATSQLDSVRGRPDSEERFKKSIDFPLGELKGKMVLDAGCGMGRFAEIVAKYGGIVIGVDMSRAVDVAVRNLGQSNHTYFLQADISRLPFKAKSFDFIYSLGVLHHTPNPKGAFQALVRFLKPGGKISISVYSGYNQVYVKSTNFWRKFTTRMPKKFLYYLAHLAIPLYYFYRLPIIGLLGKALFPISLHPDPEWRVLDTFDCYSPVYQSYHTHWSVYEWFRESGLTEVGVLEPGVSFIGSKPEE